MEILDRKPPSTTSASSDSDEMEDSDSMPPPPDLVRSKLSQNKVVDLAGTSAHPMFLGAMLSPEELTAIRDVMNPKPLYKSPSYYDTNKKMLTKKQFTSVISKEAAGCAEAMCEMQHPIYGEIGHEFANRLPQSVVNNLHAGAL